jgi:hypothetical protein
MALTPPPARLATLAAAPARVLAAGIGAVLRRPHGAPARAPGPAAAPVPPPLPPLGARLRVPVLAQAPQTEACARIVAAHAALAAEDRWAELLAGLARADAARAAAPGGARVATLASEGARAALGLALSRADWAAAAGEIDRLTAVAAAHADDPMAAQILAQAHLDLGWARRGVALADPGTAQGWRDFLAHTAAADAILDRFDPIACDSPLLAGTRYRLLRGIEDGEEMFRDWYEDWSDLDPTSPEPHALHAVHLLPDWFGSFAEFDAEARAAARRTAHLSGAAAYAVFYLAGAEALGHPPPLMDLDLFLRGLVDHQRATGCQFRANVVAGVLTELLHGYEIDAAPGSPRARMVRGVLQSLVKGDLREFHLSAWENGEACIHYAMEQVFGADLARGAEIHPGPAGLEARLPA